jgi:hypothetical protein
MPLAAASTPVAAPAAPDDMPLLVATPEDMALGSRMAARIDAAMAESGEAMPAAPVALTSAEPVPISPAKSAAPSALPPTPFDAVEGIDVDGMFKPEPEPEPVEAVLEGETVEDAVLEPEPEAAPQPVLLTPEPEPALLTPEPEKEPARELSKPEPEKAPVLELTELSPEPEPVKAEAQEFTELSPEPEPVKAEAQEVPELTAEPEPEPVKAEAQELPELTAEPEPASELEAKPEPEPEKAPPRDETTESGVWALDGSQPKAREVEPAPPPEPELVAEVKPRQPIDLGELPPAPEEPMQLAATWEFMGMAEAQGHAPEPASEERGMELETTNASSGEDTGSSHDEVALASTWDFVPQWQPGAPAGTGEPSPSAPSEPVAEKAVAAPVSTEAPVEPVTTAKFGIGMAQSTEAPVEPVTTAKFGIGTGEPAAAPAAKAEAGWDQMFPPEDSTSPAEEEAPKAPAPVEEADPFTEFATEAARKRTEKPPSSEGNEST